MAKAVQSGPVDGHRWTIALEQALVQHYGSLKAAAISLGNYDQAQFRRDLDTGKFRFERLEYADDEARAAIAAAMFVEFGAGDPSLLKRRLIRTIRQLLDELSEVA